MRYRTSDNALDYISTGKWTSDGDGIDRKTIGAGRKRGRVHHAGRCEIPRVHGHQAAPAPAQASGNRQRVARVRRPVLRGRIRVMAAPPRSGVSARDTDPGALDLRA